MAKSPTKPTDTKVSSSSTTETTTIPVTDAPFAPDVESQSTVSNEVVAEELPTSFDALIAREIKKYDEVTPKIEELKKEFLPLKITSVEDTDGYEKVSKALRLMIGKRTAVENKRKLLKADSIAFGKAVDDKAKEITQLLAPIEQHLKEEKEKIDTELEKIEQLKEEQKLQKIKDRHAKLIESGMSLIGNEYVWNNPTDINHTETLLSINLETFDDDSFHDFALMVYDMNEKAKLDLIQQEEDRKKEQAQKEEELRIEKEKTEEANRQLEEQRKKLQDEHDKLIKEREDMRKMRLDMRKQSLDAIGIFISKDIKGVDYLHFLRDDGSMPARTVVFGTFEDALNMDANEWAVFKAKTIEIIELTKQEDISLKETAFEEARKKAEDDRIAKQANEDRIKKETEDRIEKERLQKIADDDRLEKERIANLSDKEKLADYAKKLLLVEQPEMKTAKWSKDLKALISNIDSYAK